MVLRIKEAVARAERLGRKIQQKEIAAALWPDKEETTRVQNMANLSSGRTKRIDPDWVAILTAMLGCSADYLFGLSND